MKKTAAIIASAALCMSMSVPAFADTTAKTVTDFSQSTDIDVNVVIDKSRTDFDTVYSVDLEWESMDFTYQFSYGETMTWDSTNHVYLNKDMSESEIDDLVANAVSTGYWTDGTSTNGVSNVKDNAVITVTNHSNAGVVATAAFDNGTLSKSINNVTASLDKSSLALATAEGRTVKEADSDTFVVSISGRPNINTDFNIGTVSVNLSAN